MKRWVALALWPLQSPAAASGWQPVPPGEEIQPPAAAAPEAPRRLENPDTTLVVHSVPPQPADFYQPLSLGPAVPTANQLPDQEVQVSAYQLSPFPGGASGGTGNQNYAARLDASLSERLQVSAFYSQADDPLYAPIQGLAIQPANYWESYGGALQWQLFTSIAQRWKLALAGSLEGWNVGSGGCDSFRCKGQTNASPNIFNTSGSRVFTRNLVGALQLPLSWQASRQVQLSFVPGLSVLPSSQGAGQGGSGSFYGTNLTLAAGASWRPIPQLTLFGSGLVPLGPGTNSFNSALAFSRVPILTAGLTWAMNPRIGLEGLLTNGWGATPATALLALPSDNRLGYSARFTYTPGAVDTPPLPMQARQRSMALGGLTVNTALVPADGTRVAWLNADSRGNAFGYLGLSISNIFQLELFQGGVFNGVPQTSALASTYASDGGWNWRLGGKAVAFRQRSGTPFSGAGRISLGRNTDPSSYQGYVFAETINTWEANEWLAFNFNPKLAWSGVAVPWGLGLSANVQLGRSLQFLPELNLVLSDIHSSNGTLALRWLAHSKASIDVYVSSAAGLLDIGQLLNSHQARVGGRLIVSF